MEECKTKFVPKFIKQSNEKTMRKSMKIIDDYKTQFEYDAKKLKQFIYAYSYAAIKSELSNLVVESVNQLKIQGKIDTNTTWLGQPAKSSFDNKIEALIKQIDNMFTNDPDMLKDNPQALTEKGRAEYELQSKFE